MFRRFLKTEKKEERSKDKQGDKEEDRETFDMFEINLQGGSFVNLNSDKTLGEIDSLIENNKKLKVLREDGSSMIFYTDKVERVCNGKISKSYTKDEIEVLK